MALDAPQTAHGLRLFVSPSTPAAQTAAAYNAAAFTAGANAYKQVGLVMDFGENVITRTITTLQPTDNDNSLHYPGALDHGSRVLQVIRDDDQAGQAALATAAASKSPWTLKILISFHNDEKDGSFELPGSHDDEDSAIYLRGIVRDLGAPIGAAADVPMRNYGIQLTELEFTA